MSILKISEVTERFTSFRCLDSKETVRAERSFNLENISMFAYCLH